MPITFTYEPGFDGPAEDIRGTEGGDAASTGGGTFAVVVDSPTTDNVELTQFSASGTHGNPRNVSLLEDSAIARLSDGRYAIAGERDDGVHIWLVDPQNGNAARQATGDAGTGNADIAALNGAGYVVVCEDVVGRGRTGIDIKFFPFDGTRPEVTLTNGVLGSYTDPQVAVLQNGNVAVTWTASASGVREVMYAVYTSTGAVVRGPTKVATGKNDGLPVITPLAAGFAIAFARMQSDGDGVIGVQAFGATGTASAGLVVIDNDFIDLTRPAITAMPDNVLAVSAQMDTGNSFVFIVDTAEGRVGTGVATEGRVVSVIATEDNQFATVAHEATDTRVRTMDMTRVGEVTGTAGVTWAAPDDMPTRMTGGVGADRFTAGGGDDVLIGAAGSDQLDGGGGDDRLIGGQGTDTLRGGAGHDIVDYSGAAAGVEASLLAADGRTFGLPVGTQSTRADGDGGRDTLFGIEELVGSRFNDILTGDGGNAILRGGGGDDRLSDPSSTDLFNVTTITGNGTAFGGAGNDRLSTRTMFGGTGDDTYIVTRTVSITEFADEGTDTVLASISHTLGAFVENLTLTGTAAINGTGNELDNVIVGNDGANILNGLAGADRMTGGKGDDTYIVDNVRDVIVEVTGEGTDTVRSSISFAFSGQSLENLILTGTANINATGNTKANVLVGNVGNNILDGKAGADHMTGGLGDDTYIVDNVGDVIVEVTGEGTDTVRSSISFAFTGQSLENLILTGSANINATANSKANILVGNSGANILDGKTGADHMTGGKGDDTYIVDNVGDVIVEVTGEGTDTVRSSISFTFTGQSLENLILTGSANINATANSKANILVGNSGSNILDGRTGADHMTGGKGDDTYIVDNVGDVIVELTGEGTDTVRSSISFAFTGQSLENLILTGSGNINGTANSKANTLVGNAGNNILDGKTGVDHMTGGLGNDTYVVDSNDDVIVEARDEGTDLILASVSYVMKAGSFVENLTLTGTGNTNATGNGIGNILTGNSGANILDGAASTDTLIGGGGRDTLTGGTGSDRFVFKALSDSTTATSDLITDLSNSDVIDLSAIDGNTGRSGVQGFTIVDAFTGAAGQLTLTHSASTNITTLTLDVNGDRVADMTIRLAGDHEDFDNFIFGGG